MIFQPIIIKSKNKSYILQLKINKIISIKIRILQLNAINRTNSSIIKNIINQI